ncbi:MAG: cytochrome c oxidase assembly protein [Legionellales bacterium]|jgi:cytochrome c oxidase assembly protein subunit 11|nr:cytochrome c oxidase assembly protein [Legionellales bacterium]
MSRPRNHTKLVGILIIAGLLMFGFGFALVPIYNSMCKALSINGKVVLDTTAYDAKTANIVEDREIVVQFVATNTGGVPWAFYPKTREIRIHPGEVAHLAFYAENKTNRRMTVQAIPSVTPGIAAKYIKKTECFCFTQQTLNGHEAMDMPLLFHLDPDLPKSIKTITLAYALFDVTDRAKT